jgi:hypothetical protein
MKWKTTLSFAETQSICCACYVDTPNLQHRTAENAVNRQRSTIAKYASSGTTTARRASTTVTTAGSVELDKV